MFSLSCCFIVAIGLLHNARSQQDTSCTSQPDGLYTNYSSGCRSFYRCENYANIESSMCPSGTIFDVTTSSCQIGNNCVVPHCAIGDYTSYAVPQTHCSRYYKCQGNGDFAEKVCPPGTTFSSRFEQCMRGTGVCYEPLCSYRSDGTYADTTTPKCRRAFRCQAGSLKELIGCSQRQSFDGKQCIPENFVKCESQETTALAIPIVGSEYCSAQLDGWRIIPKSQCREYVICKDGLLIQKATCSSGQQFDGSRCSPSLSCDDSCAERSDGFHMVDGTYCKKYLYCSHGLATTKGTCPEDTIFNGHVCVPSPLHTCLEYYQDQCKGKPDGNYRDYSDCHSYYTCRNGELLQRNRCDDNLMWSDEGYCTPYSEELCSDPEPWTPCSSMAEGLYQNRSIESGCRSYYYCFKNGMKMRLTCSGDRVFDGTSCVPANSYKCQTQNSNACSFKQDGYYKEKESGCKSYYYCSGRNKITYVCPERYIFNGRECVAEHQYSCPYGSEDCKNISDGYYADTKTKCRDYFYCLRNKRITTLTCSDNRIFNGERCVQPLEYECPGPFLPHAELCSEKEDGYYADMTSGCSKYFRCLRGKIKAQYTCLPGYVYDGQSSCVPKKCSPSKECKQDGFFPDYDSNCRDYYFCIEGKKTTLRCPGDQVFNGQLCVPKYSFSCQSDCDRRRIKNGCDNNL